MNVKINNETFDERCQRELRNERRLKVKPLEVDEVFFEKHKRILVDTFKYYANMSNLTSCFFISYSGFLRFAKDCDIVFLEKIERQNVLNEKRFSLNQLNILFSKFSSEIPIQNIKSNNKFQKNTVATNITNYRICFKEFLKLLICISNKIFNPLLNMEGSSKILNQSRMSKKTYDFNVCIERMLELEKRDIHKFLDNFIELNLTPLYPIIKSYLEKEVHYADIFKRIFNESENIEIFLGEMKPILHKIYLLYSSDQINLTFEQFSK